MPDKYPKEVKEECVRLRKEEGVKHKDIATILNVSLPTIKRWLKGIKVLKETSGTQVTDKPTVTQGAEGTKVSQVINTLSDTKNTENIRETGDTDVAGDVFSGIKATYDIKKSVIILEPSDTKDIISTLPTTIAKDTPELEPVPGSYTKPRENMPKQDLDVDRPEDPLDNFFGRGMVETLIPIGLIIAGYVMKKENDPTTNQFKGEEIRSKGLGWLSGDRGGDNW